MHTNSAEFCYCMIIINYITIDRAATIHRQPLTFNGFAARVAARREKLGSWSRVVSVENWFQTRLKLWLSVENWNFSGCRRHQVLFTITQVVGEKRKKTKQKKQPRHQLCMTLRALEPESLNFYRQHETCRVSSRVRHVRLRQDVSWKLAVYYEKLFFK